MASLARSGFESQVTPTATTTQDGEGDGWTAVGTVSITTTNPRSGAAALSVGPSAANQVQFALTGTQGRDYFLKCAFRFSTAPNSPVQIIEVRAGGAHIASLRLGTNSKLRLFNAAGTAVGSESATLSTGTWYVAEMKINVPAAGNGTFAFRLDGTEIQADTSAAIGNTAPAQFRFGHGNSADTAATVVIDDLACNDNQGSNQNTYAGLGKIILLKPTADSAVGTGWQEADGTTDALYTNVDNRPPTGVAATPVAGATQIKNASATAGNLAYDATCESYTTGGVGASDTILLVEGVFRLSGSSTTGTNNALARIVSNPADAGDTTFTAAFDVVAGAEPSGWRTWKTAIQYLPSVTKGTQPVIRLIKNAAASRTHMADLMGINVEYLPVTLLEQPVDDSIAGTDSVSKAAGKPVSDSIQGTDNVARAWAAQKAIDDNAAGTDASVRAVGKSIADAIQGTDTSTRAVGKVLADSAQGTDEVAKAITLSIQDGIQGTDEVVRAWDAEKTVDDTAEIDDEVAPALFTSHSRDVPDTIQGTDNVTRIWGAERTQDDSAQLADATAKTAGKRQDDSAQATDATAKTAGKVQNDAIQGADAVAKTISVSVADGIQASDATSIKPGKSVDDAAQLADNQTHVWDAKKSVDDTGQLSDSVDIEFTGSEGLEKQTGDTASVTDSVEHQWDAERTQDDTAQVSDSVGKHIVLFISDGVGVSDDVGKAAAISAHDSAGVSDSISKTVGKRASDTAVVTDSVSRAAAFNKLINDAGVLTDSVSKRPGILIEDLISITDDIQTETGFEAPSTYPGSGSGSYVGGGDSTYVEEADQSAREGTYA